METSFTCSCCEPTKSYANKRALRKHQMKYDSSFIFGGELSDTFRENHRKAYEDQSHCCEYCSTSISYEDFLRDPRKRFCNRSCSAKFNNNRLGTGAGTVKRETRARLPLPESSLCLSCSKPIAGGSKYCSTDCQWELFYRKHIGEWLSEVSIPITIKSWSRRYVLEQADNRCGKCGWSEIHPVTGLIPLHVDHIDGDSTNNKIGNLRVLCPNCHSLTPNFGSLNKGKGRQYRREYRQALRSAIRQELKENNHVD